MTRYIKGLFVCSFVCLAIGFFGKLGSKVFAAGTPDVNAWAKDKDGTEITLTSYNGNVADVVIPNAADFIAAGQTDVTKVWVTKAGLQVAAGVAHNKSGTLSTSSTAGDGEKGKVFPKDSDLSCSYEDFYRVTAFNLGALDVSNVTNMHHMFRGNYALANLNGLENWDVSNATETG